MQAPITIHLSVWWLPIVATIIIVILAFREMLKPASGMFDLTGLYAFVLGVIGVIGTWGVFFAIMYFLK